VIFLLIFAFCVGMVFLMLKSEDFSRAVGYVGAVLLLFFLIAMVAASCS
jgi:hypothetical protein